MLSILDRDVSRIFSTRWLTRACDREPKGEPPILSRATPLFARTILDAAMVLAFATLATGTFAQNEKRQFSECLHQAARGGELVPQRNTGLDHAFEAIYDLDFYKADGDLLEFIAERPYNPLGPAAQPA